MGGYGTRLRPLTLSVPKPLIQFCNKPIIEHQIEALVTVNVTHVILSVGCHMESIEGTIEKLKEKFAIRIDCLVEEQPLGTAGPIRLAESVLLDSSYNEKKEKDRTSDEDSFFVLNSDIMCDFPLQAMFDFHKQHSGNATILVTSVENPERFGVVVSNEKRQVLQFVEKPQQFLGNHVNAGLYLLRQKVLTMIQLKPTSIEKEIFPVLAAQKQLFCFPLEGYWVDLGKPRDFLTGTALYLKHLAESHTLALPSSLHHVTCSLIGRNLIHPTAVLGEHCVIGPNVVIGAGCVIEDGVRLVNSVLMDNVHIGSFTMISGSILGWESRIGRWVHILGLSVVGRGVTLASECIMNQVIILPHQSIKSSILAPDQIIM